MQGMESKTQVQILTKSATFTFAQIPESISFHPTYRLNSIVGWTWMEGSVKKGGLFFIIKVEGY